MRALVLPAGNITTTHALVLAVLAPVAAAAAIAWRPRRAAAIETVGLATSAIVVAVCAAEVALGKTALLDHALRLVRLGLLDVNVDLWLDPMAVVAAFAVLAIAAAHRAGPPVPRLVGCAAALLAVLSDDLAVAATSLAIAHALAATAARPNVRWLSRALAPCAGALAILLGGALLHWTSAGVFASSGYAPELAARFLPAQVGGAVNVEAGDDDEDERGGAREGDALLTLTTVPGSIVYLDDARTPLLASPDAPLRAPFVRHPIPNGPHALRIRAGVGADDHLVERVDFPPGLETTLVAIGPSLALHAVRDELAARDAFGESPGAERFAARGTIAGIDAVALAALLLFVGAAVAARALPGPLALEREGAVPAIAAALVAARLAQTIPSRAMVLAVIGVATAALAAAAAARVGSAALVTTGAIGSALFAAGRGAPAAAALALAAIAIADGLARRGAEGAADGLRIGACAGAIGAAAAYGDAGLQPADVLVAIGVIACTACAYAGGRARGALALAGALAAIVASLANVALGDAAADRPAARVAVVGVALVGVALVLSFAVRRARPPRAAPVAAPAPLELGWGLVAVRPTLALARVAAEMDAHVIAPAWRALAFAARAAAWTVARLDDAVSARAPRVVANASFAAGERLGFEREGRGRRAAILVVALVAFALALAAFAGRAHAAPPPGSGHIVLEDAEGGRGPIRLVPARGGYAGDLIVRNAGGEPLAISRVAIRGDAGDVRAPAHVSARFDGAAASVTLAPGEARRVLVTWMPERDPRVRFAMGHVIVTSSDESAGEVAMGFRADVPEALGPFTHHLLTWMIALPLLGVIGVLALRRTQAASRARAVVLAVSIGECALGAWALARFAADVGRADGNEGLQLVDRVVWIRGLGAEYFVGVDGASVAALLLVPLVALAAAIASAREPRPAPLDEAAFLLLLGATIGAFVAIDLLLLFVFLAAACVGAYLLVAGSREEGADRAAVALLAFTLAGALLVLLGALALASHVGTTFLVDGTRTHASFAVTELARVSFAARPDTVLGLPLVKAAYGALFLGFVFLSAAPPLHGWLLDAYAKSSAPAAAMLAGAFLRIGPYLFLRVGVGLMPDATRWAGGAIAALGVATLGFAALRALAERDLRRLVAWTAIAQTGFCLMGAAALAPQGLGACVVETFTSGLAAAAATLVVFGLGDRARSFDLGALGGAARSDARTSSAVVVSLLALSGAPALGGFWGDALALFAGAAAHPALVVAAAIAWLALFAATAWALARLLRARADGATVRIDGRDVASIAPLLAVVVVLGLWPTPVVGLVASGVRDLADQVVAAGGEPLQ